LTNYQTLTALSSIPVNRGITKLSLMARGIDSKRATEIATSKDGRGEANGRRTKNVTNAIAIEPSRLFGGLCDHLWRPYRIPTSAAEGSARLKTRRALTEERKGRNATTSREAIKVKKEGAKNFSSRGFLAALERSSFAKSMSLSRLPRLASSLRDSAKRKAVNQADIKRRANSLPNVIKKTNKIPPSM